MALASQNTVDPIKVMLVDDSAIIRGLYRRMLGDCKEVEIVADAGNGEQAIRRLKETPSVEVIILDIEMPIMDGLTAIPHLLEAKPGVMILMSSTLTAQNAEYSMRALQSGAADYLQKPTTNIALSSGTDFRTDLLMKINALGEALRRNTIRLRGATAARPTLGTVEPRPQPITPRPSAPTAPASIPDNKPLAWNLKSSSKVSFRKSGTIKPRIIVIGSSTGGPEALRDVFASLSGNLGVPIVITQHMPPTFTTLLAARLKESGAWDCREGIHGEELKPGLALVAPGGKHMLVKKLNNKYLIEINEDPPENYCRPAVDPLFRSVSQAFGGAVLAVVLTGMGNDGTKGGQDIINAGGTLIAQDEETSIVWGMPGSVANAGLCSMLVSKKDMAGYINNFITRF